MAVDTSISYVWGNLVVGVPARSAGNFRAYLHHSQGWPARSAGKFWAFCSVSGEIPARRAGKFWSIWVASVKFCNLAPPLPSSQREGR